MEKWKAKATQRDLQRKKGEIDKMGRKQRKLTIERERDNDTLIDDRFRKGGRDIDRYKDR